MREHDQAGRSATPTQVETGRAAPSPVAGGISLLTVLITGALLSGLIAAVVSTYDSVAEGDDLTALDFPVLQWMIAHRTPTLNKAVTLFTDIGGPVVLPIIVAILMVALAWRWRSWTPIALMLIATAGSIAMTVAGKDLTGRLRPAEWFAVPPYETSPSFPSGHTLNSTVVAIILSYLVYLNVRNRRARVAIYLALGGYAFLMGLSRVYLGHHWTTDLIAGWAAGAAWGIAIVLAHRLLVALQRRRYTQDHPDAQSHQESPPRASQDHRSHLR